MRLKKATFRFINDPSAQVAALLAGDVDGIPRFGALQSIKQFQGDKRFVVEVGSTSGKGIVAINNKKAPFNDVRVRRAITPRDRPKGLHRRRAGRPGQGRSAATSRPPMPGLCRPDGKL